MPWNTAVTLLLGGAQNVILDYDTTALPEPLDEYNIYDILGGPADPVIVTISISAGADLGSMRIDNRFNNLSQFTINFTEESRIVGKGGRGGRGGIFETEPGGPEFTLPGRDGGLGGSAIISAFDFALDADAGFVLGGGGGGGGGSAYTLGQNSGGGGGGGGQGWNDAPGAVGALGSVTGKGTDGSLIANGLGGLGRGSSGDGGDGAPWGNDGADGETATNGLKGDGGATGKAILGIFNPITVTLTGAKNQATLESESRLVGGTSGVTYA